MSNHEAAKNYHRRGLSITLCPFGAKNPLGDGWSASNLGKAWQKKSWTLPEIDRAFKAGRLHFKLRSDQDFEEVIVVPARGEAFVLHAQFVGMVVLQ